MKEEPFKVRDEEVNLGLFEHKTKSREVKDMMLKDYFLIKEKEDAQIKLETDDGNTQIEGKIDEEITFIKKEVENEDFDTRSEVQEKETEASQMLWSNHADAQIKEENDHGITRIKEEIDEEETFVKEEVEIEDFDAGSEVQQEHLVNTEASQMISTKTFFGRKSDSENSKKRKYIEPTGEESDLEIDPNDDLDYDDDVLDPDFLDFIDNDDDEEASFSRSTKRRRQSTKVMLQEILQNHVDETSKENTTPNRTTSTWQKADINIPALPPYEHPKPISVMTPFDYFNSLFTMEIIDEIVYQSNLYARQQDVNTQFRIDRHELMIFIGVLLEMGIINLPSIYDYWSTKTRIPQVAEAISCKKFKQIRTHIHFVDNEKVDNTVDRFFKVRFLFTAITKEFLKVPATPLQSVDEVMVAYKGTTAGNLRQYIQTKPDKWGFKLFCRASIDGFIHDIIMYQGEKTFSAHPVALSSEEEKLQISTKLVVALVKTLKEPNKNAIYADNFFTSLTLAEYLRDHYGCRYVGTARENRIGKPNLMSSKEMAKKNIPRGTLDYCSKDGILTIKWKDNKIVTVLSTDAGIEPMGTVLRWDKDSNSKKEIAAPHVIKQYNGHMGGIDKSDMLTHLYKTPLRARRYYMKLFGYVLDLCICNAWILYKRDCIALQEKVMSLKDFRLDISKVCKGFKTNVSRVTRKSLQDVDILLPKRGQRANVPSIEKRQDATSMHMPHYTTMRQTCKFCTTKEERHRSRWMCEICKVALCLSDVRNCFADFHKQSS